MLLKEVMNGRNIRCKTTKRIPTYNRFDWIRSYNIPGCECTGGYIRLCNNGWHWFIHWKKVSETVHSFTEKQTFQDVTINGTFDGNSVVNKSKLTDALANYGKTVIGEGDLNNITNEGEYTIAWGAKLINEPTETVNERLLIVHRTLAGDGSFDYTWQEWRLRGNSEIYVRSQADKVAGIWSPWEKIALKSDLLENYTGQAFNFANFVNNKIVKKYVLPSQESLYLMKMEDLLMFNYLILRVLLVLM